MGIDAAPIKELDFEGLADLTRHSVVRTHDSATPPGQLYLDATSDMIATAEKELSTARFMLELDGPPVTAEEVLDHVSFEAVALLTAAKKISGDATADSETFTPKQVHLKLLKGAGEVVSDIKTMFRIYHGGRESKPARFAQLDMRESNQRQQLTRWRKSLQGYETRLEMELVSHPSSGAPEGAAPAGSRLRR